MWKLLAYLRTFTEQARPQAFQEVDWITKKFQEQPGLLDLDTIAPYAPSELRGEVKSFSSLIRETFKADGDRVRSPSKPAQSVADLD